MRADSALSERPSAKVAPASPIALSRWVNEPYPALTEILSARDVARLTRRPHWLLVGLALIGRFPKRARFRGRALGWWLSDVLEWMAKDLRYHTPLPRGCRTQPRQTSLPLESRNRPSGRKGSHVAKHHDEK
jgi:predicted DNA-binding transcriptional regulator AlpA